jgi:urease accessory protein UreF
VSVDLIVDSQRHMPPEHKQETLSKKEGACPEQWCNDDSLSHQLFQVTANSLPHGQRQQKAHNNDGRCILHGKHLSAALVDQVLNEDDRVECGACFFWLSIGATTHPPLVSRYS